VILFLPHNKCLTGGGTPETIITSFPSHWKPKMEYDGDYELLRRIRSRLYTKSGPAITSVFHLAALIITSCIEFVDNCEVPLEDGNEHFLDIYAAATGVVVSGLVPRPSIVYIRLAVS
jgi:hypothetical protein